MASAVKAAPLPGNSISLAWEPAGDALGYRVYSDMGTGYGFYVFKAETDQLELTDAGLRPGLRYQYHIRSLTSEGEVGIAWVAAETPAGSDIQGRAQAVGVDGRVAPIIASKANHAPIRVTPAPTPLPPDTIILGLLSANDYTDEVDNRLTIVGEVRNDSHLDVGETAVMATFYDTQGQVIGEAGGSTLLAVLAPGVRSPFMITLPRPGGLANYSLRATGRPINLPSNAAELAVVTTRRFEDTAGFYHIAGVIENPGRRVEQARVVVTLYDRGGRVVNVGFGYPQPASLSPGDRADFDISFTYYPKVFSHLAVATAD